MKLYNTLSRKEEEFTPSGQTVTFYSCGPTVYDKLQIGNWSAYIRWDVLARIIRQKYQLDWYINITDVGHLVSDADEGQDKLEKGAKREGLTAWQVADMYTKDFLAGLDELNISVNRENLVKATDHIAEQIDLIKKLEEKGHTYTIDDGVYYDVTTFPDYGRMAKLDIAGQKAGARVEVGQKRHPADFALWKFSPKSSSEEKRDMEWESPWGIGFPGWHIECSAMAIKYLGETLDIHAGGIDHIPIHHTNEIAQSEAATGKQFAKIWLHTNFLMVDGQKIAKSLGNSITLDDVKNRNFSGQELRFFVLQSHFRTEANFTWEGLEAAKIRLSQLQAVADLRFQANAHAKPIDLVKIKSDFTAALEDNLNTPKALAVLSNMVDLLNNNGLSEKNVSEFKMLIDLIDKLLGLKLLDSEDISDDQKSLLSLRQQARIKKDWQKSDQYRDQLTESGLYINDTTDGQTWRRAA